MPRRRELITAIIAIAAALAIGAFAYFLADHAGLTPGPHTCNCPALPTSATTCPCP